MAALVAVVAAATLVFPIRPASAGATFNQRILELVNKDRATNGLAPVAADPGLAAVAEDAPYTGCGANLTVYGRAKDMGLRNYFDHKILDCGLLGVTTLLNAAGINLSGSGENIGWMSGTTDPLVAANNMYSQWMGSDGHRRNILNPQWTRLGVGSWNTSPGQSWSGGGYALTNVFIGVQIFSGGAVPVTTTSTTVAPTTSTTAPTTSTTIPAVPVDRSYHALAPARILDTRDGTGGVTGAIAAGSAVDVQVTGKGGVPATGVSAVVLNVTVTQPTAAAGFLTLYPSGTPLPVASNLNFTPGQTVPNLVTVKVGANGRVSTFNSHGSTHVIFDVAGWFSDFDTGNAGHYRPLVPARILDTRNGTGGGVRLGPNSSLELQVAGAGGVPASGVDAAVLNIVATQTTATSFVSAYPTGTARPFVSNLNFDAGDTVANRAIVKLGTGGRVTIYNLAGGADIIVDVGGWFTDASAVATGGNFVAAQPARILDTRDGTGGVSGIRPAASTVEVQVTGRGGVPTTGVSAVVLNVTATQPAALAFLTLFPSGNPLPVASDLNFEAGETRPNLAIVRVGAGGKVSLYVSSQTHVLLDVQGWFLG